MNRPWTAREERRLREMVEAGASWKECSNELGRTAKACQAKGLSLGLHIVKPVYVGYLGDEPVGVGSAGWWSRRYHWNVRAVRERATQSYHDCHGDETIKLYRINRFRHGGESGDRLPDS